MEVISNQPILITRPPERDLFWRHLVIVLGLVSVLWFVFLFQYFSGMPLPEYFGNIPQHREGIIGIFTSPFLHGSFEHIISNTLPIALLLFVTLSAYPRAAFFVLLFIHITSGAAVWFFGRENSIHIGISGIIYGLAGFLLISGLLRRERRAALIAIFVTFLYGGMAEGFVPKEGVSWQSHLYGALSGAIAAFIFRKFDIPAAHEFDAEPDEDDRHFFDTREPNQLK